MGYFAERYGPWALIAGASEGIGEAFAHALARRGLKLILIARREDKLRAAAERVAEQHGVEVHVHAMDLATPTLAAELRHAVGERELGLLIYNAAYSNVGSFLDQPLDNALRTIDVNCRGPVVACHTLAPPMCARGRGGIILMGSLAGMQGSPRIASYAASKAFDLVLGESLWGELRGRGVDVLTCVAGATRTPGYQTVASTTKGPVMDAAQVVEEALEQLGERPSMVPGLANKLGAMLLGRLPRRRQVLIMDAVLGDSEGSRE